MTKVNILIYSGVASCTVSAYAVGGIAPATGTLGALLITIGTFVAIFKAIE